MTYMDNEVYDTFGEQYQSITTRLESLEKITNGDLIVMPDGTTYSMGQLGLVDVSVRIFVQADAPTGLNSSTDVGDVWFDTDDSSQWFWDGLMWVSKAYTDNYSGGSGLEAFGPGVVSRLLTTIDITTAASAPASPTYGDTWRDTSSGNAIKRWNGSAWITITDSNIVNAIAAALTDPLANVSDGGIRVFYQTDAPGGLNSTTHKGDLWYDTNDTYSKHIWNGTAWVNADAEEVPGATDGLPPSFSPTPTVFGGIGAIFVTWTSVTNHDPVWYNVYLSTDPAVPITGANYSGRFQGEVANLDVLPNGTPLAANTTYYVKIIAVDADGAAAPSVAASGTARYIQTIDIGALVVTTAKIANVSVDLSKLADGSVSAAKLIDGAVTTNKIVDGAILTAKLASAAVQTAQLADSTVLATKLADNAVTLSKMSDGAVSTSELVDNAITLVKMSDGSVSTNELVALSVITSKIAASAITANEIAALTIVTSKIAANAITSNEIAASTILAADIATDTITALQIASSAITTTELAALSVNASKIVADSITANQIAAAAIGADELAANSVIAGKIAASAVTAGTIAAGAITAGSLAANSVTSNEIAANAVIAGKIAANAVTAGTIAASAVTAGKIAAGAIDAMSITSATLYSSTISSPSISGGTISSANLYSGNIYSAYLESANMSAAYITSGYFRSSSYSQYVEMGDTGWGDAVDEFRMWNYGYVSSMRNYSSYTGTVFFSMQSGSGDGNFIIWPRDYNGNTAFGRQNFALCKSTGTGHIQARSAYDGGYTYFSGYINNVSSMQFKRDIQEVGLSKQERKQILKAAKMKSWKRKPEDIGVAKLKEVPAEEYADQDGPRRTGETEEEKRVRGQAIKDQMIVQAEARAEQVHTGLVVEDLPDSLKGESPDAYEVGSVLGFLWDVASKTVDEVDALEVRIAALESK